MTYVKDTMINTFLKAIMAVVEFVFNNVEYDLNSWMKQQNH